MGAFISAILKNGNLIDIVSCVFTVLALVFTLYFWLLDHLSEDETKFIEGKPETLAALNACLDLIDHSEDPQKILDAVWDVNKRMEVILNYRFWARSKQKEEYNRINGFYRDSRYLISTLRRSQEKREDSLVGLGTLNEAEIRDIRTDYRKVLYYIIEFIENWE